ncbi:MAG: HlyD family efflux transporter periplasmic adaptor subunit [Candidatus Omnitrophica bacterium]|nr:HlyD family efflux transporter periplasmic adaptor subunit [Candidatus Omnitrophota bacterium]
MIGRFVLQLIRLAVIMTVVAMLIYMVVKECRMLSSEQALINTEIISIHSPISGIIHMNDIVLGSACPKDYPLFKVNNPCFGNVESTAQFTYLQNLIDVTNAELRQNVVQREKYVADQQRFKTLEAVGGVSRRDLEGVENALAVIDSAIEKKSEQLQHQRERLSEARQQMDLQKEAEVLMPLDGVIWAVVKKNNEMINANDEVIQVIDPKKILVDAFFHEKYVKKLSPGKKVVVREIGSRRQWTGEIMFVRAGAGRFTFNSLLVDPPDLMKKRLVEVRIRVEWQDAFTPGEFNGVGRGVVVFMPRFERESKIPYCVGGQK